MSPTQIIKIEAESIDQVLIQKAGVVIKKGGLVVLPTETVYGIAANMLSRKAVDRLYKVKNRPKDKPFSVLIDDKDRIESFARDIPVAAYRLISAFWPGPLTLVLKSKAAGETVGLRMPDDSVALRILKAAVVPVVCPSANLSGNPPACDFAAAIKDLDGLVELAIDAGKTRLGIESSVVDLSDGGITILREAAIKIPEIEAVAKKKTILFVCTGNSCRSVMAEGLLKKILKDAGRGDVDVLSAGIAIISGYKATHETIALMDREGIDVSGHFTRRISPDIIKRADIVLVMEKMHESRVVELAPQAKNRVFLLKEFAKIEETSLDIEDPIGRPVAAYEQILYTIKQSIERVAKII